MKTRFTVGLVMAVSPTACTALLVSTPRPASPRPSTPPTVATAQAAAVPTPTSTAVHVVLPDPGGTCSASQFVVGEATSQFTFSTLYSRHVIVDQPLTNTGAPCSLALPKVIGLASATGPFAAVEIPNMGHDVCVNGDCHYVYPTSFEIRSGQTVNLVLNAWWWSPGRSDSATDPPAPPCGVAIDDVMRAEFPMAAATMIEVKWDTVLEEVCSSRVTMNITIEAT